MKKAFIDGKRAALYAENGNYYLLHSVKNLPDNATPGNKKGFYYAIELPGADSFEDAELLAGEYGNIICEGTPEFADAAAKNARKRVESPADMEAAELPAEVPAVEAVKVDASEILTKALSAVVGGLAGTISAAIAPAVNSWGNKIADEAKATATPATGANVDIIRIIDGPRVVEIEGRAHHKLDELVALLKAGVSCYLYGPAGTGKTTLCKQAAKALGLEFYMDNKICNDYTITGYTDAVSKFVETEFYRAYTRGGLYMLDEMDASDENALSVLNSALAGDCAVFPGVGRVSRHKDFIFVATGNTIGKGANMDYTGRNCLDAASLDRFPAKLYVGYDKNVELATAGGDENLVDLFHALRDASKESGNISLIVTPRALDAINKMRHYYAPAKALEVFVFGGMEKDDIRTIAGCVRGRGVWFDALREIAA